MADQEKTDVQTHGGSDMAALSTKVGEMRVDEVRVEDTQTRVQPLTSLDHVYGHLQSHANHDDSSDAATVEQAKVVDIKRNDSSHTAVPEKKPATVKVNNRERNRRRKQPAAKKDKKARKNFRPDLTEAEKEEEMDRLVKMVIAFFETHYDQDDLACWQAICRDLGMKIGVTIAECKQTLKIVFINIFDFVEACGQNELPKYFDSRDSLSDYILETGLIFPLYEARKIPILTWMLIKVG